MANSSGSVKVRDIFVTADGVNVGVTFALVSCLFMLWGLCNGMIDVMDKHFQDQFHIPKAQSAWVQFAHYTGYCFMALPAGYFAKKLGYKGGIITGLIIVALAGFCFLPAGGLCEKLRTEFPGSPLVGLLPYLFGIFLLAMGLTFLETVANPYTTVLGPRGFSSMRINLAQSCNGVGWIFGPILGGMFFYNSSGNVSSASSRLFVPYVAIACAALVLAAVFAKAYMPDVKAEDDYESEGAAEENVSSRSIWTHPHFVLAVFAQFFYVAAQAGIFAFFINYVVAEVPPISASIANLSLLHGGTVVRGGALYINEVGATKLLSAFGFTLFLLGRIVGTALMKSFKAHSILGIFALANTVLTALIFLKLGWLSVVCVFLTFFFMSIMFPTIFSLGIWGLGEKSKTAASFIVMAIMGGALLPKLMGEIADKYDMSKGFIVPMFCFAYVAFYAFSWARLRQKGGAHPVDEKSAERVLAAR